MSLEEKTVLRRHFRALRQQLSMAMQARFAEQAADHFVKQDCFKESINIACYLKVKSEIDLMPLIQIIWSQNKNCYLPRLSEKNDMAFVHYNKQDDLIPNRFGILEPKPDKHHIELSKLDLVIMPLVAYDRYGHRLGAGGGYYDRTFALSQNHQRQPLRIGWAYSLQKADQLPHDEWDIDLHAVQTELDFTLFTS